MGNKYLYKPTSAQGFLQQLEFLLSRSGYRYYHVTYYPEQKQDKWDKIDQKLIAKYQTNSTRSQRYRNKEKKNANFWFLRYENVAVILMATDNFKGGKTQVKEGIVIDDEFYDIQKKGMKLKIGLESGFKIHYVNGKLTISMTNEMFTEMKFGLLDNIAKEKNLKMAINDFQKLNGLPAWSGINKQKFQLLDVVVRELKRHNIKAKKEFFFVKLSRDKVKVFE